MTSSRALHFVSLLAASGFVAAAQAQPESPPPSAPAPMREIGGGLFEIGGVRIDKNARTVSFPASVNMTERIVEYLLVSRRGKTHESAFVTDVEPFAIHLAMLLLGAKGEAGNGTGKSNEPTPPPAIDSAWLEQAPELKGDSVFISVTWKKEGEAASPRASRNASQETNETAGAEDFIWNNKTKASMPRGAWIYNGSMFLGKDFLAQKEGEIVALVLDPEALVNNPRPGNRDDSRWEVDPKKMPPEKTPVEITIRLEGENKEKQSAKQPPAKR